ncbi:uncharacterized protein METZ01_LOCUS257934, partial [marine metagenome]
WSIIFVNSATAKHYDLFSHIERKKFDIIRIDFYR